jgi:hypothetical protein
MQRFSLLVDDETARDQALEWLWNRLKVRGEVGVVPLDGKFKLDVVAETDLPPAQLEKLPGKRV